MAGDKANGYADRYCDVHRPALHIRCVFAMHNAGPDPITLPSLSPNMGPETVLFKICGETVTECKDLYCELMDGFSVAPSCSNFQCPNSTLTPMQRGSDKLVPETVEAVGE